MRKIEIVDQMLLELEAGRAVELVIVTGTEGSSPRAAGAWMAVFEDDRAAGTVGGGRVEEMALREAAELLATGRSRIVRYTMGGKNSDTGMICGGAVRPCYLHLDSSVRDVLLHEREILASRGEGVLRIDLTAFDTDGEPDDALPSGSAAATMAGCPPIGIVSLPNQSSIAAGVHDGCYLEPICPEGFAYIFGCGHVGRALAPVLTAAGFVVVACDDRSDFLSEELLPQVAERRLVDYREVAATCAITGRDLVISATATHGSDLSVVSQVLAMGSAYLGCLGSKKKTAFIHAELAKQGFTPEQISSIHMPVGAPIHAETPEEIAISIAAEMIDFRRTVLLPRPH